MAIEQRSSMEAAQKQHRSLKKEERNKKKEERSLKKEERNMKKEEKWDKSWMGKFKARPRDGATCIFLVPKNVIEGATCTF